MEVIQYFEKCGRPTIGHIGIAMMGHAITMAIVMVPLIDYGDYHGDGRYRYNDVRKSGLRPRSAL